MSEKEFSQITNEWASKRYAALLRLCQDNSEKVETRLLHLDRLYQEIYIDLCSNLDISFGTLYSRITYIDHLHRLPRWLSSGLHQFRLFRKKDSAEEAEMKIGYAMGLSSLAELIKICTALPIPEALKTYLPTQDEFVWYNAKPKNFEESLRFSAVHHDAENEVLEGFLETIPGKRWKVKYAGKGLAECIDLLESEIPLPLTLQLLKVEIEEDNLTPSVIVLQPDYLIDVSSVAESFQASGKFPIIGLIKQYLPFSASLPLLIGNIANMFLDELMMDENRDFKSLIKSIFTVQPLAIAMLNDQQVGELVEKSKIHFSNIKNTVIRGFDQNRIEPEKCLLEPTFFSSDHGLQGRLDVFYPVRERPAIVELKSGKVYKPNSYRLAINHYVQTLLYDLMIKFSSKRKLKTTNYILYSGVASDPLRFAPPTYRQQIEAMALRNKILSYEYILSADGLRANLLDSKLFEILTPDRHQNLKGFHQKDLLRCYTAFQNLTDLEKKYFISYSSFIAREKMLAKVGHDNGRKSIGQSNIWRDSNREKLQRFELLAELKLVKNESGEKEPMLWFARSEGQTLSNFRKGDIAVLYPSPAPGHSPLNYQLFKGTIIQINSKEIQLRLRYKQFNTRVFEQHESWQIEHDLLDTSYTSLQKGLFAFVESTNVQKELYLGLRPPQKPVYHSTLPRPNGMTDHQFLVFGKALQAKDYFLLWGPPGTGKTSILLRNMVAHLLENSQENILLLAYTNRAVDEICAAIESISADMKDQYLRIGSRYSTGESYIDQLLQIQIEAISTRKNLLQLIQEKRIVVSTVASVMTKPELLKIQKFDRVIIDEASQILEPMLVGLLPKFKQVILIGDHQQLPAVVLQDQIQATVKDEELLNIGLNHLGNSLFERLYKKAKQMNWDWAYDQLHEQGRLHEQLMSFTNQFFYEGCLDVLPQSLTGSDRQSAQLALFGSAEMNELINLLSTRRRVYFSTAIDYGSTSGKTNISEAEKIKEIILSYHELFKEQGREFKKESVGIITPYRAQIACITEVLTEAGVDPDMITIDTVERYQGGARDIILLSLCTNSARQFEQLVKASADGIDRKLNVAITRAREQLIILGNKEIMLENELYRNLIYWAESEAGNLA